MPASTHSKFFEYKPNGGKKLLKTHCDSYSIFPNPFNIREANQAIHNQDTSSPLNTSNSNTSSSSCSSTSTITGRIGTSPLNHKLQATTPSQQIPQASIYHLPLQTTKPLPHSHTTYRTMKNTTKPSQYYSQSLPSLSHAYVQRIAKPFPNSVTLAPSHQSLPQQYIVHYHPQTYHNHSTQTSHPMSITHGISKQHKMIHPVRQTRTSQCLCGKVHDPPFLSQNQEKAQNFQKDCESPKNHVQQQQLIDSKSLLHIKQANITTRTISNSTVKDSSMSQHFSNSGPPITETATRSSGGTKSNHLKSQMLPSIADLFGPTQLNMFKSAAKSVSNTLNKQ